MIKVIIEIDETDSEALQRILEITGMAAEIYVDDPMFPDRGVNSLWYMEEWEVSGEFADALSILDMTPYHLREAVVRGEAIPDLTSAQNTVLWQTIERVVAS